jgi:hypothetical protein
MRLEKLCQYTGVPLARTDSVGEKHELKYEQTE